LTTQAEIWEVMAQEIRRKGARPRARTSEERDSVYAYSDTLGLRATATVAERPAHGGCGA